MSAQDFAELHQALLVKHARAYARTTPDSLPPEDLTAELVRVLEGLEESGVDLLVAKSPDAYLRSCMPIVARRAGRRRTLLGQVTAGDDLSAVSTDLGEVEKELPPAPREATEAHKTARKKLESIHAGLTPHDALVFSLIFEDDRKVEGAAQALTLSTEEASAVEGRALALVRELRIFGDEGKTASDERTRELLVALAQDAEDPHTSDKHVDEPLLALLRDGDRSEDLFDAIAHVAKCVDCRARVAEGETTQRSVVVMAIDAGTEKEAVLRAAEQSHARLVPRGEGRFTAVIESDNLVGFKEKLTSGAVARVAVAGSVDIPVARRRAASLVDATEAGGIDAAELKAWSDIGKVAPTSPPPSGRLPKWVMVAAALAVAALSATVALALTR